MLFLCFANNKWPIVEGFPENFLTDIKMNRRVSFQIFSNQSGWWQKWQVAGWKGIKPNNCTDLKLSGHLPALIWNFDLCWELFLGHPICADLFTFQTWWPMQLRQSHAPRTQVWPSISRARSCKINFLTCQSSVGSNSSMDASFKITVLL